MGSYQVVIQTLGDRPVALLKALRLTAGHQSLRDVKKLADFVAANLPCVIIAGVEFAAARHVVDLLQNAGATVNMEKSKLASPMLLCPTAGRKYDWHWLFGPTTKKSTV